MASRIIIALLLSALSVNVQAQNLTGVWRGYFLGNGGTVRYKYEVQINAAQGGSVKGVTYSYRTTVFYGKAALQGIYMSKTKNIIIRETHMIETKIADGSDACPMTCYLEYSKEGNLETLTGTFTSITSQNRDCGSGTVYLEKVEESEFYKEDFLVNKKPTTNKPNNLTVNKPTAVKKPTVTKPASTKTAGTNIKKPATAKPQLVPAIANKNTSTTTIGKSNNLPTPVEAPVATSTAPEKPVAQPIETPKPKILELRENKLARVFQVADPNIEISFFDNGEIDGDTISVYVNNELVINKQRLTAKAQTIQVKASPVNTTQEIVVVAESLGTIPPNTAFVIIKAGRQRYEIVLTSTEQRNAKLVIEYTPPSSASK
ncbi:MAG: hypothetical protein ACK4HE_08125 [Chitinophagaceae bacterium]